MTARMICSRCNGMGQLKVSEPECNGGRLYVECDKCNGYGRASRKDAIESIRLRRVAEMGGPCGPAEACHTAVDGCCALSEAIEEYDRTYGKEP